MRLRYGRSKLSPAQGSSYMESTLEATRRRAPAQVLGHLSGRTRRGAAAAAAAVPSWGGPPRAGRPSLRPTTRSCRDRARRHMRRPPPGVAASVRPPPPLPRPSALVSPPPPPARSCVWRPWLSWWRRRRRLSGGRLLGAVLAAGDPAAVAVCGGGCRVWRGGVGCCALCLFCSRAGRSAAACGWRWRRLPRSVWGGGLLCALSFLGD